jgi:tripeptide aminopeptidase
MRFTETSLRSLRDLVVPRFLRYARVCTASSRHTEQTPSTAGQWDLAKMLAAELGDLGLRGVTVTDSCYVVARLPARAGKEAAPVIGFLAHLDTSDEVSGAGVQPRFVESYDGASIELADGLRLDPALDKDLAAHIGKAVIHADGTTLLGADDKAGIAEIMGAVEYMRDHPEIQHGEIEIIFSPDEETGKGLPDFPSELVHAKACYTVDGGAAGEIEAECFNAAEAVVTFNGKAVHPGYAKGKLINAVLMAASFVNMLPRAESPETTDGYEGYFYASEIRGGSEQAQLDVLIRDFDRENLRRRKERLEAFARAVEAEFPGGRVSISIQDQYYNMKEKIAAHPEVLEKLKTAVASVCGSWRLKPVRGGTDGSRLTEQGVPTPNIFTGGRNWHGKLEWASVPDMEATCAVIIELSRVWADRRTQ